MPTSLLPFPLLSPLMCLQSLTFPSIYRSIFRPSRLYELWSIRGNNRAACPLFLLWCCPSPLVCPESHKFFTPNPAEHIFITIPVHATDGSCHGRYTSLYQFLDHSLSLRLLDYYSFNLHSFSISIYIVLNLNSFY